MDIIRRLKKNINDVKPAEGGDFNINQGNIKRSGVEASGHQFSDSYHGRSNLGNVNSSRYGNNTEGMADTALGNVSQGNKVEGLSFKRKITGTVVIVLAMLAMFIFTNLTTVDIFFWLFFFAMFWFRLDSRISIAGALVGLVLIMFLTAGQGFGWWQTDKLSEQVAVGVYFFLVIGVVKQIWEYRNESKV